MADFEEFERPVTLYVYDLSQGLARQLSQQLLGTYLDAIYHTSVIIGNREFYYGQGIQVSVPGQTHHGEPMETVSMGSTTLSDDVIMEYLESMKSIYSPEAYDLFMHNCNNFSNDFCMFLTGRNIPVHITSLPQAVLNTPFGQMLRPQIEEAMRPITTAPTVSPATNISPPTHGAVQAGAGSPVKVVKSMAQLEQVLDSVKDSSAVVFFTSATCRPCKVIYPVFEQKAKELDGKAVFVKVDVGEARDVGSIFGISATPTFITFSKGEKIEEWKGVGRGELESNINVLMNITYPAHPHSKHSLPITFSIPMTAITYSKVPPLDKVRTKLGAIANTPAVSSMIHFLQELQSQGAREAPLPDLSVWVEYIQESTRSMERGALFPIVDIFRATVVDTRVSGWIAEERDHKTISALLHLVSDAPEAGAEPAPYALRLVTLQALCNLFTTPLAPVVLCTAPFTPMLIQAVTSSLLDTAHVAVRVSAASLAFNLATYIQKQRSTQNQEVLEGGELVELFVGILEAVKREEEDAGGLKALLVAGLLTIYCAPEGTEVLNVIDALGAGEVVKEKGRSEVGRRLKVRGLCEEIGRVFSWKP
ncbi:PPPDE putative peptidase domain-containing protein [Terfezia claveryi]|nr:PPPDE putative peptidase domain-containing protein [Terfezia claveryi]